MSAQPTERPDPPGVIATARSLLAGGLLALLLVAAAQLGQRVALPLSVVWLGEAGNLAGAIPLLGAAVLAFVRAWASHRLARSVRSRVLDLYLEPFERGPALELPSADEATSRVAIAMPALAGWAIDGVASLLAGLAAVPIVVGLLSSALGPMVLLPLGAAGLAGGLVTFVLSQRVEDAWNRSYERSRELLVGVSEAHQGAVEIRAHDGSKAAASALRRRLDAWSATEGRARYVLALSSWGALAATIVTALGTGALLGPSHALGASSSYLGWLLVLAAVPTLQTVVSASGTLFSARRELGRAHRQRLAIAELCASEVDEPIDASAEVRLEGISYTYPGAAAPVLEGANLVLEPGKSLAIVGANGAGKTTLLYVLLGIVRPEAGRIVVGGREARLDNACWRRRVAFLSQRPFELADGSVGDNLRAFAPDASTGELVEALAQVGLWSVLRARAESDEAALRLPFAELSRGQSRRVLVARTLMRDAELVVLDEPEANLDAASVAELAAVLAEVSRRRRIVAAVHDGALAGWAGATLRVGDGRVRSDAPGAPAALAAELAASDAG